MSAQMKKGCLKPVETAFLVGFAVVSDSSSVKEQVDDDYRRDDRSNGSDDLRYGYRRLARDLSGLAVDYEVEHLVIELIIRDPDRC